MAINRSVFSLCRFTSVLLFAFLTVSACRGRTPDYTPEELAQATTQVREAYYAQDYFYGVELGERWVSQAPEALELRAWTLANLVLTRLEGGEPRRMAEEMVAEHPESPWSWFAFAHAVGWESNRQNGEEVLAASERAIAGLPGNPDPVILHAELLWRHQDREPARAFLEGLEEPLRSDPDVRALMVFHLAPPTSERTQADVESIIGTYEDVLAEHPDHLVANYGLGRFLLGIEGERERARAYLQHAAALSPSPMPHFRLWEYTAENLDLDPDEKQAKITEDFRSVLDAFPDSPGRWAEMASDVDYFGYSDLRTELEERILQEYPESWAAERVVNGRISSALYEWRNVPPVSQDAALEQSRRLEGMINEFLAMPHHRDPALVQEAYWNLSLLENEKPNPDLARLSELVETWAGYRSQVRDIWADQKCLVGAINLAQHPQTLQAAKRLLAAGQEEVDKFLEYRESQSERSYAALFNSQEAHVRSSKAYHSIASSLVLGQEGSFEEAEAMLGQARAFDPEAQDAHWVLPLADFAVGQIKEMRAEFAHASRDPAVAETSLASAEEFYLNGLRRDYEPRLSYGLGWTNPNETALKDLFEKRNGGLDGFEDYLASAKEGGLEARRAEILATRIEDPQPILPFALETLEGEEVTPESYRGKVVIINFWGTW